MLHKKAAQEGSFAWSADCRKAVDGLHTSAPVLSCLTTTRPFELVVVVALAEPCCKGACASEQREGGLLNATMVT